MDDDDLIVLVVAALAGLFFYLQSGGSAASILSLVPPAITDFVPPFLLPTATAPTARPPALLPAFSPTPIAPASAPVSAAPASPPIGATIPVASGGADMIDLSSAQIFNSPDVRSWPATAAMIQVQCDPSNTRVNFTKRDGADRWPDQALPGFAPDTLQYTVWLFLNIDGAWCGAGFIECWYGRDGVGDPVSDWVRNWYYDANRWGPMAGHQITPGESIAMMVTAGDARGSGNTFVAERSNVVVFPAPSGDTGTFNF